MSRLMIVESAAKARTIAQYLGDGWRVMACMGHVRDLPVKALGVDVDSQTCKRMIWINRALHLRTQPQMERQKPMR